MGSDSFYDSYVERQLRVGVNARHRSILRFLRERGMRQGDRVLEIGTGVGTLTGLLLEALDGRGHVTGVDTSERSIAAARERLARWGNVTLLVGDALEAEIDGPFDVVVLPDVIEHIPLARHGDLFRRLASWVAPTGFVLLHYPNPLYTEWRREHRPDRLQPVDEAVHADALTAHAYAAGLRLEYLETYGIWIAESDYTVAVFRPEPAEPTFTDVEPRRSLRQRIAGRVRGWLR